VTEKPGRFVFDGGLRIQAEDPSLKPVSAWFSSQLEKTAQQGKKKIILEIPVKDKDLLGREGYSLTITPSTIHIKANEAAGIFYGLQTLLQLMPPDGDASGKWVPCAEITDYPRFGWRGLMLDVSRHFFTKQEVERYIDEMVRYKYNTLHLHLSDDQGWRIEIKSLPMLTQKRGVEGSPYRPLG